MGGTEHRPGSCGRVGSHRRLDLCDVSRGLLLGAVGRLVVGRRLRQYLRQTPVHHLHLAERPDHDVARLEVAVNHPMRMRVADSLRDLFENGDEAGAVLPGLMSGARLQHCRQRFTFDELHGQERPAIGHRAQLVCGRNAGMLELPGDLRFDNEALGGGGVGLVILAEQLDGDFPLEPQVARLVDDTHAAPADFAQKLIARRSQNRNRRRAGGGRRSGLESGFLDLRGILRHSPLLLKRVSALFAQTWPPAQSAVVKKRVKNGQSLKMTMKRVNKIRSPFFRPAGTASWTAATSFGLRCFDTALVFF